MKYFVVALLFFAAPLMSTAQKGEPIDLSQTVAYLQGKLGPDTKLDLKANKALLIVTTFKNGKPYLVNELYMVDVDYEDISYNEEEGQLMVRCKKGFACCDRKWQTKKQRDQYNRMKFDVPANSRDGFIKAMQHLAKLYQIPNYQNSEPFE